MYKNQIKSNKTSLSYVEDNKLFSVDNKYADGSRLVIKNGLVIDPANNIEDVRDIAVVNGLISEVKENIDINDNDVVINADGTYVVPGLVDMHLHLGDLFEVSTNPIFNAAADGVAIGLSPGAGNTFMSPSLLGAETDRGLPMTLGVYEGAANVLSSRLDVDELIQLYNGTLDDSIASDKMSRNAVTITTAPLTIGIKDHMGHFIMSDENIDKIYEITDKANLVYMSHTQDPEHSQRIYSLSKGRHIHLGHTNAAGCGSHMDSVEGMKAVIDLCKNDNVSGEFVTTMLRPNLGCREGLKMTKESQELCFEALADGIVKILISDGQNDATMKGFGDTRDNISAILELAENGVLSLSDSIATMTSNPAKLIGGITKNDTWQNKIGNLSVKSLANITLIDPKNKKATYTIVNGEVVAFEGRNVRRGNGAGGFISKFGFTKKIGVGHLAMYGI